MSLKEICRACLRTGRTMCSLVVSIMPNVGSPPSVVKLWRIFTKKLTAYEDTFPDKICIVCLDKIQRIYSFMLQCESSEDILKKMMCLKKPKTGSVLREHDSLKIIKSEFDLYASITQTKTENIEWIDTRDVYDEVIILTDSEPDQILQHTEDIKQEPEDVWMENHEYVEIESEDRSEIFECSACRYECSIKESLEKHIIENHTNGNMCKLCNKEFESTAIEHCSMHLRVNGINNLASHLRKRTDNNEKSNGSDREQTENTQFEVMINPNADSKINQRPQDAAVVQHQATQDIKEEPELDISVTNDKFDENEAVDKSSIEILKCSACCYKTNMIESLEKHIIKNHMEEKLCKLCNKEFKCTAIQHCSTHLGVNSTDGIYKFMHLEQYKCEICPKTFVQKSYLKRHLKIHTGERPFKCVICLKTFRLKCILMDHLRCHSGERPFKCEKCTKTFGQKSHLADHLKCHTGERPFKCDNCSKTFRQKNALTTHLRCHTGERPFKCVICSKDFFDNRNLMKHSKCHKTE